MKKENSIFEELKFAERITQHAEKSLKLQTFDIDYGEKIKFEFVLNNKKNEKKRIFFELRANLPFKRNPSTSANSKKSLLTKYSPVIGWASTVLTTGAYLVISAKEEKNSEWSSFLHYLQLSSFLVAGATLFGFSVFAALDFFYQKNSQIIQHLCKKILDNIEKDEEISLSDFEKLEKYYWAFQHKTEMKWLYYFFKAYQKDKLQYTLNQTGYIPLIETIPSEKYTHLILERAVIVCARGDKEYHIDKTILSFVEKISRNKLYYERGLQIKENLDKVLSMIIEKKYQPACELFNQVQWNACVELLYPNLAIYYLQLQGSLMLLIPSEYYDLEASTNIAIKCLEKAENYFIQYTQTTKPELILTAQY